MKQFFLLLMAVLFVIAPSRAGSAASDYKIVSKTNDVTLCARERDGLLYDFKMNFQGRNYSRPFWINVTNPTYAPEIHYEDINGDGKKELIIILTKGYGTGVLDQEVNVFHVSDLQFGEVLVDLPMAIVNKNIQSSLTASKAEIMIGKKHYEIDVKELGLQPETLFSKINFGSIIKYEVRDHKLYAVLHPQLSPGAFTGSIIIEYEFRDQMYQAKSIHFE
jgi:hypothetical protein